VKSSHRGRLVRRLIVAPLFVVGLAVSGSWLADEARDLIYAEAGWKDPAGHPWYTTSGAFVLAIFFAVLTVQEVSKLFRPRNRVRPTKRAAPTHPHVILFLSNLSLDRGKWDGGVPEKLKLTGNLGDDLAEMIRLKNLEPKEAVRWPWEMPLRGLYQHHKVLRSVTLVCSPESYQQAHLFAQLLVATYRDEFPELNPELIRLLTRSHGASQLGVCPTDAKGCQGDPKSTAWDFEEFDDLFDALDSLLKEYKAANIDEKDIIIDITSGQKPNSIVGALVTVNRRTKFQYVQTGEPYEAMQYDLMTDSDD
jgi:hypothetical protein